MRRLESLVQSQVTLKSEPLLLMARMRLCAGRKGREENRSGLTIPLPHMRRDALVLVQQTE